MRRIVSSDPDECTRIDGEESTPLNSRQRKACSATAQQILPRQDEKEAKASNVRRPRRASAMKRKRADQPVVISSSDGKVSEEDSSPSSEWNGSDVESRQRSARHRKTKTKDSSLSSEDDDIDGMSSDYDRIAKKSTVLERKKGPSVRSRDRFHQNAQTIQSSNIKYFVCRPRSIKKVVLDTDEEVADNIHAETKTPEGTSRQTGSMTTRSRYRAYN